MLFRSGNPILSGITIDGGLGGFDSVRVIGKGQVATYRPDASVDGKGSIQIGSSVIHFVNLEPIDISGLSSLKVVLPGAADIVDIRNGFDLTGAGTTPAIVISGTTGGIGFERIAVWNTTTLSVDTSAVEGDDRISLGDLSNAGIANFILDTRSGSDLVGLVGSIDLPGDLTLLTSADLRQSAGTTLIVGGVTRIDAGSGEVVLDEIGRAHV